MKSSTSKKQNAKEQYGMPLFIEMAQSFVAYKRAEIQSWMTKQNNNNVRLIDLVDKDYIQYVKGSFTTMILCHPFHLKLIERYKDKEVWEKEKPVNNELFTGDDLQIAPYCILNQMVAFLQGEPYLTDEVFDDNQKTAVKEFLIDHEEVRDFVVYVMNQKKWIPFMQAFTRLFGNIIYTNISNQNFIDQFSLSPRKTFISDNYYLADPHFDKSKILDAYITDQALWAILCGDFNKAEELNDPSTVMGLLNESVIKAYKGDNKGCVALVEILMHDEDNMMCCCIPPFIPFVYAVCLKNVYETESGSEAKHALSRLKELEKLIDDGSKPWITIISSKAQNKRLDIDRFLGKIDEDYDFALLDAILVDIALRFYYGYEDVPFYDAYDAEKFVKQDSYKLLYAELLHSMANKKEEYESLSKELGFTSPLINGMISIPKWERQLDEMIANTNVSGSAKNKGKASNVKQARVVYNMWASANLKDFSFTPRLQKSSDGINWTSGRNIALKNFGASTEGMTDVDIQVSRHVKKSASGWYGETFYTLQGKEVLMLLVGHPHVYLEGSYSDQPVQIVKEDLQISVERKKDSFVFKANVDISDDVPMVCVTQENLLTFKIVKLTTSQRELIKMLSVNNSFPKEAENKIAKLLGNISHTTTVLSDMIDQNQTDVKQVDADDVLTVRMRPSGDGLLADVSARPFGPKGPSFMPGRGSDTVSAVVEGNPQRTQRNRTKEKQHWEAIKPLLFNYSDESLDDYTFQCNSPLSGLQLLESLHDAKEHCNIEWPEGEKLRIAKRLEAKDIALTVKGAKSWFEVDGEIKVSENKIMRMAELLEALRDSQGHYVKIGDNEFIALTDQLRKQLAVLESMANIQRKKVQLSPFSTSSLDALDKAGISIEADKAYKSFVNKLQEASGKKFIFPKGLQAELRDYQREGVRWMAQLAAWGAGACLADDMGLGKTIQTITLMLARKNEGASLVVVPTSVSTNWRAEIERFAPQLNVILLNVPNVDREKVIKEAGNGDVVISTYGLLVTESERLTSREWNMIVLDEAHTIKNKETKMSQSAMQLQGSFRLLLTGTPLQNHLGELWNLFQFSNPGLLGSNAQFQEKFIVPIEKLDDKERMRQLKRIVTPFILRRTKNEVLDELPEKSEITITVQLSDEEMAVYENLRREAIATLENGESTPMQTLAELTKLRQAACNVRLIDDKLRLESSKLSTLLSMVNNLIGNGHRALVFSQFTSHLALVREALDAAHIEYLYLDGSCMAREREKLVESFQTGTMPLFLISLKAGGTGLNLTAADYVFHLDPWWNPAIEDQASDRTYRIGQTRPVTIYRLIAQQTIEEKIVRLHSTKKSLADSLLAGTNSSHKLTKEEILQLL